MDILKIAFGRPCHKRVIARTVIASQLYRKGITQIDIAEFFSKKGELVPQARISQMIHDALDKENNDDIYYRQYLKCCLRQFNEIEEGLVEKVL